MTTAPTHPKLKLYESRRSRSRVRRAIIEISNFMTCISPRVKPTVLAITGIMYILTKLRITIVPETFIIAKADVMVRARLPKDPIRGHRITEVPRPTDLPGRIHIINGILPCVIVRVRRAAGDRVDLRKAPK